MNIARRICLFAAILFWPACLLAADIPPAKMTRVALMDFSTDDNSYRSIQAKEVLIGRTNSVGPFLTDKFPSTQDIFSKYDRDKDGGLNLEELKSLAVEIQGKR